MSDPPRTWTEIEDHIRQQEDSGNGDALQAARIRMLRTALQLVTEDITVARSRIAELETKLACARAEVVSDCANAARNTPSIYGPRIDEAFEAANRVYSVFTTPSGYVCVPVEPSDEWAERFCEAVNWDAGGAEHKIVEGVMHSTTFRELAKGYIKAALKTVRGAK